MNVIEVSDLHKQYGNVIAIDGIDLVVDEGEIVAILGPNGAGKTSTVEILEGYRMPGSGTVRVLGSEPWKAGSLLRQQIGLVLQECALPPALTVGELVGLYASYYQKPRDVDEVIDLVGLTEAKKSRVRRLSGGQQRRVDLALAIIGDPKLIFLDEPTTGFDPGARRNAWDIILNMQRLGKTVVLTTHYMEEAYALAGRLYIFSHGKIVATGTPAEIIGTRTRETTVTFTLAKEVQLPLLAGTCTRENSHITIACENPVQILNVLTSWSLSTETSLTNLEVRTATLEDVYLELTNE